MEHAESHLLPPYSGNGRRPYIVAKCGMERYITAGKLDGSKGCFDWPAISIAEANEIRDYIVRACNAFPAMIDGLKEIRRRAQNPTAADLQFILNLIQDISHEAIIAALAAGGE